MRDARAVVAMSGGSHTARAMSGTRSPDDRDDAALMVAYAGGEAAAFDTLYARHKGGIYRYLLRHCNHAGTADELFQDIWMNVIRVRTTYAPTAKFATWLYTLARNRLVDHWRAAGQATLVSVDNDDDGALRDIVESLPAAPAHEPLAQADARQVSALLKAAVASLPHPQRDAFLLQYEAGLSLAEIAALTGVGMETVKSRLRYAIAKLRAELAPLREDPA